MDNDGRLFVISYPDIDKADFDQIQLWRKELGPRDYALIDPHITFVYSVTPDMADLLAAHTSEIAASHGSIKFVKDRTLVRRVPGQDLWYLFLVPGIGSGELTQLHDRLQSGEFVRFFRKEMPFVPHITIGSFTDAATCAIAADKLAKEPIQIKATVSKLTMIHDQGERIELLQTFGLVS